MSINVVRIPFRSRGVQYRSGELITHPERISLFATRLRDKAIVTVTEQNINQTALYLERRRGVVNAKELLQGYLGVKPEDNKPVDKYSDPEYVKKVHSVAKTKGVDIGGLSIEEAVAKLKNAE